MTTLFLGSSIIERWDIPIDNYVNLGISGLTTNELMDYYSILSKYKCTKIKKIIIYVGSNDIIKQNQPDKIVDNITQFFSFLLSIFPKTYIYYIAILKSPNRTKSQKIIINYVNDKIREKSKEKSITKYCNINRELSSDHYYLSDDKTHFSTLGYEKMNKILFEKGIL